MKVTRQNLIKEVEEKFFKKVVSKMAVKIYTLPEEDLRAIYCECMDQPADHPAKAFFNATVAGTIAQVFEQRFKKTIDPESGSLAE